METDLGLSVDRAPDFDALYRLQSPTCLPVVVEADGAVEGTGAAVVRDGYLNGEVQPVGYLGDLRLSPRATGRMVLDRFFRRLLEDVRERFACDVFLSSVIASNARAMRALTVETRRSRKAGRPVFTPVGDFDIRSLHLLLPRRLHRSAFVVRRGEPADVPAIAHLLDADARRRPFGFVFSEGEVRRRLDAWPGLTVDSFYLAHDGVGNLVGCLALWDATPVKRLIVTAYRGAMRRVRLGHDLVAALIGRVRLPAPGERFRYRYVTHQAIPSDDPDVLHALLAAAYRDARAAGDHFISVCAPLGSPLEPAFRGFSKTDLRARLFLVRLPEVDVSGLVPPGAWPGFEMALV